MKPIIICAIICCTAIYGYSQQADSSQHYFQKGLTEKSAGRHKTAFDFFQIAVVINPQFVDAQRELGLEAVELRQAEIAKKAFLKVIEAKPDDQVALEKITNLYYSTRKWDEAIKYGEKMIAMKIGTQINYIVGKSYYEKEDFGKAFRYLDAAYKEEPQRAEIPFMFARSFVEMSNYKAAVKYYQEAITLDTTKTNWVVELAMAYSSIPDEKSAIKYYEEALRRGHKADNVFMENLSNSYIAAGMPERGIDVLTKLLETRPADMELLYSVADTYYRMGKYNDAIDHWDRILQYDKENARSLYMIGICYQKKGDNKKGSALCDRAIEMDPSLKSYRSEKKM